MGGQSVTKQCKRTSIQRYRRRLQVVDTPGLFDTGMSNAEIIKEVVKCIGLSSPGPHAIILVTRIDRFTQEEKDTVEHFRAVFGEGMNEYLFVLFTRKDDLDADGKTIHDFIQDVPDTLRQLLSDCKQRYIAFNNRLPQQDGAQVRSLINMIDANIQRNGGTYYTTEMYQEAEMLMKRREKELGQQMEETVRQERQQLQMEFEERIKKLKKDNEKHVNNLQDKLKLLNTASSQSDEIQALKREIENAKKDAEIEKQLKEREHRQEMKTLDKKLKEVEEMAREKARAEVEKEESGGIWDGFKQIGRGIKNAFSSIFSRK